MFDPVLEFVSVFVEYSFSPGNRLWPVYIVVTALICFVIYKRSQAQRSFLSWLFPKAVYLHPSNLVDLKLFVLGRLLAFFGVFQSVFFASAIASMIVLTLGGPEGNEATWHPLLIGLIMVLAMDFTVYWVHRIHHETAQLWPFHSVHHSAEVMTPVTVYRKHPIYDLISTFMKGVVGGVIQGMLLSLFVGSVSFVAILGVNAIYVVFNIVGSNLRHSHIWLSYGPALEHIFISPAQHQIHHSRAKRHWNKNYGEVFAIWDWMFGTLYVPREREILEFGIATETEPLIEQPHPSLKDALVVPFQDSFSSFGSAERDEANPLSEKVDG
ncbi:MAG: sterol desaturase family protein [Pseudomonadota bacterium]